MLCCTENMIGHQNIEDILEKLFYLEISGNLAGSEEPSNLIPSNPFESSSRTKMVVDEPMRKLRTTSEDGFSASPPKIFYGCFWRSIAKRALQQYATQLRNKEASLDEQRPAK